MIKEAAIIQEKRKRGRPRKTPEVISDQAVAYGITLPVQTYVGERFLSPNDIGKILNVTCAAVKLWIYRRKLPAVRLSNGYWKVKVADFEGFLKARIEVGKLQVLITDGRNSGSSEVIEAVKKLGHQTIMAHNYSDALLKALDQFPALFVICIHPNDNECWKFAEKIRSHKSLRSFPILFIAGATISDSDIESAVNFNAQGILTRPLNVEKIGNEIQRILRRP